MHRLFVALRPPPDMRRALLATVGGVDHARWQDDAQLHLTLRFIGEVGWRQAEEIAIALQSVVGPRPTLRIEGVGTFDRQQVVRAIWARIAADEALTRLQRRVNRVLTSVGVPAEGRAFRPHITLARTGRTAVGVEGFLRSHAGLSSAPAEIDALYLFQSQLGGEGATYHVAARYPLG